MDMSSRWISLCSAMGRQGKPFTCFREQLSDHLLMKRPDKAINAQSNGGLLLGRGNLLGSRLLLCWFTFLPRDGPRNRLLDFVLRSRDMRCLELARISNNVLEDDSNNTLENEHCMTNCKVLKTTTYKAAEKILQ